MPLVTYQSLCIDAVDVAAVQGFWASTFGYQLGEHDASGAVLRGTEPGEVVWISRVPEPRTVKQRVHIDVRAESLDPFAGLERLTEEGQFRWTTLADPEGGEFCVFTYDEPPASTTKSIAVDAVDHVAISQWWADVVGGVLTHDDEGYSYLDEALGSPFEAFDFVPVPEPKTVKNRIHWDVDLIEGATIDDLVAAGAAVLDPAGDEHTWTVMADPEGNEFCVFPTP